LITNEGWVTFKIQNYRAYDRGDMFIPRGSVPSSINIAAMATPKMGVMPVHSIPTLYNNIKMKNKVFGGKGMATPTNGGVN
jgi:hypothetical protein